jgi:hypothetical protein
MVRQIFVDFHSLERIRIISPNVLNGKLGFLGDFSSCWPLIWARDKHVFDHHQKCFQDVRFSL